MGEEIRVFLYLDKKVDLILFDGKREIVDLLGYFLVFFKKDVLGIYFLVLNEKLKESYKFVINFLIYVLDDLGDSLVGNNIDFLDVGKINSVKMLYFLKDIFLIFVFIFLILEWMVFLNENRV